MDSQVPIQQEDTEADTRQRLLEAAGEVFADHGFQNATVREICRRAGANIAAVNYHFRDKERLYGEVLAWSGRVALERYPLAGGLTPEAPPEDRLRAYIVNFLDRLLDPGRPAWHGKLMSREMVEPTRALDDLAEHFVRPQFRRLQEIVAELLKLEHPSGGLPAEERAAAGGAPPADVVRRCCFSVVSQCLFLKLCRPMIQRIAPEHSYEPADRPAQAEHIVQSSLALIRAAGRRARGEAAEAGTAGKAGDHA